MSVEEKLPRARSSTTLQFGKQPRARRALPPGRLIDLLCFHMSTHCAPGRDGNAVYGDTQLFCQDAQPACHPLKGELSKSIKMQTRDAGCSARAGQGESVSAECKVFSTGRHPSSSAVLGGGWAIPWACSISQGEGDLGRHGSLDPPPSHLTLASHPAFVQKEQLIC